jgi:thioredoxin-related protein
MAKILALILFSLASTLVLSSEDVILDQTTRDWKQVATLADAENLPVLMLVSGEYCNYCEQLKNKVIKPLRQQARLKDSALVREIDLQTGGKLIDFDGEKVRARLFLSRYEVFATPTVLFLDHHGKPLREPLIGFNDAEQYQALLEQALRESHLALGHADAKVELSMAGQFQRD